MGKYDYSVRMEVGAQPEPSSRSSAPVEPMCLFCRLNQEKRRAEVEKPFYGPALCHKCGMFWFLPAGEEMRLAEQQEVEVERAQQSYEHALKHHIRGRA